MLYVCIVDDRGIGVIDTTDAVLEFVTRETLFGLRDKGIKIAGMTDDSINICSGDWLEDEFFQCCVQKVNSEFKKKRFKDDKEIMGYLTTSFLREFKDVANLKMTPVYSCSMWCFVCDCIKEVCRLGGIDCYASKASKNDSFMPSAKLVYQHTSFCCYSCHLNGKKAFKLTYLEY